MTPTLRRNRPTRGSTLLLVTVLLGVLAIVGVAAVSLGSQERINAGAKGKKDMMSACAAAARMMVWAEAAKYGTGRLGSPMTEQRVTMGDGTILSMPAHYADDPSVQVVSLNSFTSPNGAGAATAQDCTNGYCNPASTSGANAYVFVARCRDSTGREFEVEFSTMMLF